MFDQPAEPDSGILGILAFVRLRRLIILPAIVAQPAKTDLWCDVPKKNSTGPIKNAPFDASQHLLLL